MYVLMQDDNAVEEEMRLEEEASEAMKHFFENMGANFAAEKIEGDVVSLVKYDLFLQPRRTDAVFTTPLERTYGNKCTCYQDPLFLNSSCRVTHALLENRLK